MLEGVRFHVPASKTVSEGEVESLQEKSSLSLSGVSPCCSQIWKISVVCPDHKRLLRDLRSVSPLLSTSRQLPTVHDCPHHNFSSGHLFLFWSLEEDCERTAPTLETEASTSTMICFVGSGWLRTGVVVKSLFNRVKALSASSVHAKEEDVEV